MIIIKALSGQKLKLFEESKNTTCSEKVDYIDKIENLVLKDYLDIIDEEEIIHCYCS